MTMAAMDSAQDLPPVDTSSLAPLPFDQYALIIDARSPHEYLEDHIPGAVNLPVVDDAEFAEVGIRYKTDQHSAATRPLPACSNARAGRTSADSRISA